MLLDTCPPGPGFSTGFVEAPDGVKLFYREWVHPGVEINSTIVFIHGIGMDGDSSPYRDKMVIERLLAGGFAFYSVDLRGHGKSGGSIDKLQRLALLADMDCHIRHIRASHKNTKVFLYGHNFGGLLALYYCSQYPGNIQGIIVSEYSNLITENVKKLMEPNILVSIKDAVIKKICHRSKSFEFLTPPDYEKICTRYGLPVDNGILNSLESPSYPHKCMLYGKEFFSACGVGNESQIAKKVHVPVLMIFSRDDPFFDVKGVYDILMKISSFDKELIQVDATGHYSIIEASGEIIAKWIIKKLP